jgi:hypothetical protein
VVIAVSEKAAIPDFPKTPQAVFAPLKQVRFSEHSVAYLILSSSDMRELPENITHEKVLYCDDLKLLRQLKNCFEFTCTNSDMATCESQIVIYNGTKKILQSSIVITPEVIGIQNEITGWAQAKQDKALRSLFVRFRKSPKLLLVL